MTHIIQKQVLELTLDEGPEKTALQEDMVQRFRNHVLPAIGSLFDHLVPGDTVWKIDRLEVDLGSIRPEDLENALIRQLREKLQSDFRPGTGRNTLNVISRGQSLFGQFLHFLEFGHFSWNANGVTLTQLEKELPQALRQAGETEKEYLLEILAANRVQERFTRQFSPEFREEIALAVLPYPQVKVLFRLLESLLPKQVYRFVAGTALSAFSYLSLNLSGNKNTVEEFVLQLLSELEKAPGFSAAVKDKLRKQLQAEAKHRKAARILDEALETLEEATRKVRGAKEIARVETAQKQPEAIYLKNAGIVLLWPYLQRFFENLELVRDGEFISRKAGEKAVCILQSLAAPETVITENLLPLNKVLCGLDVADVVAPDEMEISREDTAAGHELIQAVIKNWSKIGNTSIKGFQTSFLQREGRLEKKDPNGAGQAGWELTVEQRSFDMLLDSFPWSITLIKLPWMPEPLHVEW